MIKIKIILVLFITFNIVSKDMVRVDLPYENEDRHYYIYTPNTKDTKPIDLVIGLHGYTGTAVGFERETTGGFNKAADDYGFIAVYPQGKFFYQKTFFGNEFISSWNDLAGSKSSGPLGEICLANAFFYAQYSNCGDVGRCAWASCGDDLNFIKIIIDQLKTTKNIKNIYVVGMSNGGMMAQALACEYPELFTGVINVVGMQHLGLSCIPEKPINFIIYGALKDETVPPINIKADDGYLYEPMDKTAKDWSNKFQCKNEKTLTNDEFDKIIEKEYFDCLNGVKIISLLNTERFHTWPGIERDIGYCAYPIDELTDYKDIRESCSDIQNFWGNKYLLDKLF